MNFRSKLRQLAVKIVAFSIVGVIVVFAIFQLTNKSEAAWFDDSYQYRQKITMTISSNSSAFTNLDTQITVNTSALISAGKLQSSCQDLRFTSAIGKKLIYYIDSGCNTTTTKIWVRVDSVPANTTSYYLYMYYGNANAKAGSDAVSMWQYKNLAAYWPLNETSWNGTAGEVKDYSVNANVGVGISGVTTTASGQYSYAGNFDGVNDYLSFGQPASLSIPGNITVSLWFKPDAAALSGLFHIITNASTSSGCGQQYSIFLSSGQVIYDTGDGACGSETYSSGFTLTAGTWYHIVVTSTGSNSATIYINGVPYTTTPSGSITVPATSQGPTSVGTDNEGGYVKGVIDDVRLYSRMLSSNEVSSLYANPGSIASASYATAVPTTSFASEEKSVAPIGYWKLDEGVGSTAYNSGAAGSSLNANLGTGNSQPSWQLDDQCVSGKCMKFDGNVDYISTGLATTQATQISGEVWVKWYGTTSATQMVFYNGDSNSNGYGIIIADGNCASGSQINVLIGGRWCNGSFSTTNLSKNVWTHIAFTNDGTYWNLYVNGKFQSRNSVWTANTPSGAFYIGGKGSATASGSTAFNGLIDDVKFYNYTRTAAQIKADYNSKASALSKGSATNLSTNAKNGDFLSNGLVGYWKLDEGTGTTAVDSSGNGNTGTLGSGTSAPTWTNAGKFGSSLNFNGSSNYVDAGNNSSLYSSSTLSVSAWIYPGSTAQNGAIVAAWNTGVGTSNSYLLYAGQDTATNKFGFVIQQSNGSFASVLPTTTFSTGQWYHLVGVADGKNIHLYINGVDSGSTSYDGTINTSTGVSNLNIGRLTSNAYFFNGEIDEARVYNRALSPVEVQQLYNWAPGPVGYWNLDEGSGSTAYDRSGNGNNGTWNGTASPEYVSGKYGKAGNIGSTDYVNIADNDNYSIGTSGQMSISLWTYSQLSAGTHDIISKGSASNYEWEIRVVNTGIELHTFSLAGTDVMTVTSNTSLTANAWHHIEATYDLSQPIAKLYLDGILVGSNSTLGGAIGNGTAALRLGLRADGSNAYAGRIDDVRIYNYARTQKQINEDMTGGHPAVNSQGNGPMGYWKFNEGVGVSAYNSVNLGSGSSAYNGTLTNMSVGSTASGWVNTGKFGKAIAFDGVDDYVKINGLMSKPTNITLSAWANLISPDTGGAELVSIGDMVMIRLDQSGSTYGYSYLGSTNYQSVSINKTYAGTGWHQFVYVVDADNQKQYLYVDGVQVANGSATSISYSGTGTDTYIGKHGNGNTTFDFKGTIDQVKIYPYALTSADVKQDYTGTSGTVMGAVSTASDGKTPDYSADREYCVPGDTSTCSAPVGEFKFEEGSGSTVNNSSNTIGLGATGIWNGTGSPHYKSGKIGKSGNFDGNTDYVDIGAFNITGAMTVCSWIYEIDTRTTNDVILAKGNLNTATTIQYALYIEPGPGNNRVHWKIQNTGGTATEVNQSSVIVNNNWGYVCGTFDGSNLKLYINGIQYGGTVAFTGTQATTASNAWIGNDQSGSHFMGRIDQLRVYNYARTQSQIAWDYNKGGPVAWYKLNECQGTIANDSSGNGNTGTMTIGGSGTQTTVGLCNDGSPASAWYNGANGKFSSSLNFDGTDDYIGIGSTVGIVSTDGSISTWFKGTNDADQNIFVGRDSGGTNDFSIELGPSTGNCTNELISIFADVTGGNTQTLCYQTTNRNELFNGNWHHIVITDGSTTKLYIDGKQKPLTVGVGSDTALFTSNAAINTFEIGRYNSTVNMLKGQLDDYRIYNYELTPAQIKNIMNEGSAIRFGPSTGSP